MNWPAGLANRLSGALAVYESFKSMSRTKDIAAWSLQNPTQMKIVATVERYRIDNNL